MPTPTDEKVEKVEKVKELTFGKAMDAVAAGEKVTRLEWNDSSIYLYLDKWLLIIKEDGKAYTLKVTDGDMLAKDWIVVYHQ